MIKGISEVLRQPEFCQLEQVQMLLHLLEEQQEQLFPLIFQIANQETNKRVKVQIGSENNLESMQICTLICANYCQDQTPIGSVGMIGPKRMLYENAIALEETTADYLSETLSN
jgi:heat-inducible transcriptional repressor